MAGAVAIPVVVALVGVERDALPPSRSPTSDHAEPLASAATRPTGAAATGAPTGAGPLRALLGEVVYADGEPIARATVTATLVDGTSEARATDGEGVFTLDGLRTDIAHVSFAAPGYASARVDGVQLPRLAEAFWSQRLAKLADAPGQEGLLSGIVVDESGAPITAMRLSIQGLQGRQGLQGDGGRGRGGARRIEDVSDPAGAFAVPVEGEAPLSLTITARGFRPSGAIEVRPVRGRPLAPLRIVLFRSNALRGRVTDADTGLPVAGAMITLDGMGRSIEGATTDHDGRYVIDTLPLERVSVNVTASGYASLTMGGVEGGRSRDEVLDAQLARPVAGVKTQVVGIGVTVAGHSDGVLVRGVIDGGPAQGKLVAGDIVTEVDGTSLAGKSLREGMSAIRGDVGTSVRLTVRKADGAVEHISLDRDRVAVPEG